MRECESRSKTRAELQQRVVLFPRERHARTHARRQASTHMSQRLQKEQGNGREGAVAGPQALHGSPSVSITGPKQLPETFLSRSSTLVFFFFAYSVLSSRREGRGEREGQSLTPARASQPPRCFLAAFVRAHRCETDKEDEMDMRRRRRRRLQPGFNETGPRSVKPVQRVLCVRSRRPLSPLAQRIDGGRREEVRGR